MTKIEFLKLVDADKNGHITKKEVGVLFEKHILPLLSNQVSEVKCNACGDEMAYHMCKCGAIKK